MLHPRRTALPRPRSALRLLLRSVADRLTAADPGLLRLLLAGRGTLSVALAAVAALVAARLTGRPVTEFAGGVTLSMMAPFLMREPTPQQRQLTLVVLALPAAAATVATAVLHGSGLVGDSCFLALVFLCFLLHPLSPRAIGLGLIAVVTTYVGLYLELPPATLPWQLLSIAVALPVIAFACFVVLPMDQAATLRRLVAAVQGRAAHLLHRARALMQSGGAECIGLPALSRELARLNEAALAADDQLALLQPGGSATVRDGLIHVELATARLIGALRQEQAGPRNATRLLLHEQRMRRGGRYAMAPDLPEPGTVRAALVELGHAVHALGGAARTLRPAAQPLRAARLTPGPLAWRMAARVTLAAGLAMAGGIALSPQRWFWAVLTVYVVFLNARSRGDTIYKGAQRLAGTLLGIASGLILADILAGQTALQVVALLLSIFGMFYFFLTSYTAGIFCVTVMLGLLYGMLGASTEQLLLLRFEETAIGAAAAVVVAAFVLPVRTRDQVMRSTRGVVTALAGAVNACRCALAGLPETPPLVAMRSVDRQVADLRLALAPLTAGRTLLRRSPLERPMPALLDCVHWARVLAAACQDSRAPPNAASLLRQAGEIEAKLAALSEIDTVPNPSTISGADPHDAALKEVSDALGHLAHAVARLGERLEVRASEA